VSTEQQENPKAILRQSAFPADINVSGHRRLLREFTWAQSLPAEVTVTAAALGGVPVAEITVDRVEPGVARPASPGRAGPGPDMGSRSRPSRRRAHALLIAGSCLMGWVSRPYPWRD
jgi:hypothetical protein